MNVTNRDHRSAHHVKPSIHDVDQSFIKNSIAAAIQIGLLFLMAAWCLKIITPFIGIVAWAAIIAVAVYPVHLKLAGLLGGRKKLSVAIIVLIGLPSCWCPPGH